MHDVSEEQVEVRNAILNFRFNLAALILEQFGFDEALEEEDCEETDNRICINPMHSLWRVMAENQIRAENNEERANQPVNPDEV